MLRPLPALFSFLEVFMRKFSFALAMTIVIVLIAQCCQGADPPQGKKRALPAGWKKLDLSKAQIDSIYKIEDSYSPKIEAAKKALTDLQADQRKALLDVLTNEQKFKLAGVELPDKDKDKKDTPKDKK
jgi:hypothetical protein